MAMIVMLMLPAARSFAELPVPFPMTASIRCERSVTILVCREHGTPSFYAIAQRGGDTYIRGYDAGLARFWAQTSSSYGRLSIFSGVSDGGQIWFGSSRRIGWNTVSSFSTSSGEGKKVSCNRVTGCN